MDRISDKRLAQMEKRISLFGMNHNWLMELLNGYKAEREHSAELEALLTRVMVAGNARLPTKLLLDIRRLLGKEK